MPETNPIELDRQDRFRFVGGAREEVSRARRYMRESHPLEEVTEIEKTEDDIQDIRELQRQMSVWGNDLGFDISRRFPSPDKYHFYNETEFDSVLTKRGLSKSTRGLLDGLGDIHIGRTEDKRRNTQTMNHETIHGVSKDVVGLCDIEIARLGYENSVNHSFLTVNEAITEMSNIYLRNRYWPSSNRLSEASYAEEPSYLEAILLIDGLIKTTSEYGKLSQDEIFRMAQRGLLNGKLDFIKLLSTSFGRGRMNALTKLSIDYDDPRRVAKLFGLKGTVEKIEQLQAGEPVIYMDGLFGGGLIAQTKK